MKSKNLNDIIYGIGVIWSTACVIMTNWTFWTAYFTGTKVIISINSFNEAYFEAGFCIFLTLTWFIWFKRWGLNHVVS